MKHLESSRSLRPRFKAAAVHLGASLLVAALAALCIFWLWFPFPFGEFAGGRELFTLVIVVDVVCGPLLTLVVFNLAKPRGELARDLGVIAAIQLGALAYGVHAVAQARPVFLAFEVDRFRVVTPADVDQSKLESAAPGLRDFSWSGPRLVGVRVPKPSDPDYVESLDLSLAGETAAFRPDHWCAYDEQRTDVVRSAKSVAQLRQTNPTTVAVLASAVARTGLAESAIGYLPMESRRGTGWVALIELASARVVGYAPVDGF